MNTVFLLLGGNLGDRHALFDQALTALHERVGTPQAVSGRYETAAWGFESDQLFLNQAVAVTTDLTPHAVLEQALAIERGLGRERSGKPGYDSRLIDIDLLLYDDVVLDDAQLTLPHPRMAARRFALAPLAEIAPNLRHPVLELSIAHMLEICEDELPVNGPL